MTVAQAPKPHRHSSKAAERRTKPPSTTPLAAFYKSQRDAIEAARAKGIQEFEVTYRPNVPGARPVTMNIKTEEFAIWVLGVRPFEDPDAADGNDGAVPSRKLALAMKEASEVVEFYRTKEELFSALES